MTHPRELEDDEMIEIAKQMEEKTPFDDTRAFFKLYNTAKGAVFYFMNDERSKTLFCSFDLVMSNLYIAGEPDGATKFEFKLPAGQSTVKMLKTVKEGEHTNLQMRYEYYLEDV